MRAGPLSTTGDLREFLADTLQAVRAGTMDLAKADRIHKIAGQITESFYAEAQLALTVMKVSGDKIEFGSTLLGNRSETEPAPEPVVATPAVEAPKPQPAPKAVAPVNALPETYAVTKTRAWCDQCDRNVLPHEADACVSAFCKARPQFDTAA